MKKIKILGDKSKKNINSRCQYGVIFSPICPDYNFIEMRGKNKHERIHDFDGMGEGVGIVYEKLITQSQKFFDYLDKENIQYAHLLLVADVEVYDQIILHKLKVNKEEFIRRCQETKKKINQDIEDKGLKNTKCLLMSEYFDSMNYDFHGTIRSLNKKLRLTRSINILSQIKKVQRIRLPLHKFWFGISKKDSLERSLEEMAMYASFGYCLSINKGLILCADSEMLSHCYNLFKKVPTPVLYLKGNY